MSLLRKTLRAVHVFLRWQSTDTEASSAQVLSENEGECPQVDNFDQFSRCVTLHCDMPGICLIIHKDEHCFLCLLAIGRSFLVKYLLPWSLFTFLLGCLF